jgi:hypothetical protein
MIDSSSICLVDLPSKKDLSSRLFFKLQGGDQGRVEVKTDKQIG